MASADRTRYGDNPIDDPSRDWLSRSAACRALARLLNDPLLEMPLTVGVFGDWGSGKTSLMRMLIRSLPEASLYVWFNAWEYAKQRDELWRAFLMTLVDRFREPAFISLLLDHELLERSLASDVDTPSPPEQGAAGREQQQRRLTQELDRLEASLYRSQTYKDPDGYSVNWQAAAMLAARAVLRTLPLADEALKVLQRQFAEGKDVEEFSRLLSERHREEYREHVRSLDQFRRSFNELIARYVNQTGRRLFVFVDDLDRCLPDDAIGVLEAIKTFFEPPYGRELNCVFVLGMDRSVVEHGIRVRYREFTLGGQVVQPVDPRQYLDKIIQVPFSVPALNTRQVEGFIRQWCEAHAPELESCQQLIAAGSSPNPRTIKRTLNILRLARELRSEANLSTQELLLGQLAKVIVMQASYPEVYRQIVLDPALLRSDRLHDLIGPYPRLNEMLKLPPALPADNDQLDELLFFTRITA